MTKPMNRDDYTHSLRLYTDMMEKYWAMGRANAAAKFARNAIALTTTYHPV